MPASVVSASDLSVSLGGRPVLRRVSLDVREGEWLGIVGPNGAGKSTLLRALAGLLPYSGSLQLRGREVRDWAGRARAREVALVRQQTDLPFAFSVREVVEMGRAPHLGWLSPLGTDDRAHVDRAIEALRLGAFVDRPVTALSGGEQQRALLAQALAQSAPLLLLDEPTAHLDVRHRLDLLGHVRSLAEAGRTVLAAVHDLGDAARESDRLLVLHRGEAVSLGPPDEVITPDLLADVFGVEAEVTREPDGLRIRYLSAYPSRPTPALS
ncbi:MAG: ABC transporter ATP-binding protein [Bacteroidota bacterium]